MKVHYHNKLENYRDIIIETRRTSFSKIGLKEIYIIIPHKALVYRNTI